ncbi:hypothetical protein ACHAW6_014585 [Cyclotella cf. meneghiniana]
MSTSSIQRLSTPIVLSNLLTIAQTFSPPSILQRHPPIPTSLSHPLPTTLYSKIIDAEFTPNDDHNDIRNNPKTDTRTAAATDVRTNPMTLIEYSQNQDPDWKSMPVAFCDAETDTYIDCTLAFYVRHDDDDVEYALGVPCEIPVVVALECDDDEEGTRVEPVPVDRNEEETREIFEMAARALMEEFGNEIRLKRTPRVLTLQGDLDGVIGDWREALVGAGSVGERRKRKMKRPDVEEALKMLEEEEEEGERYFDRIMRRDLGDDYMKLVEGDDEEIDEEILKLFDVNVEDLQDGDFEEFMKFMSENETHEEDVDETKTYEDLLKELKPSAALRLLSFIGPDEKEYTILRPLRPLLLVGKEDPDDYTRRILLSEEEERAILPKLERVCKEELEQAGFFFAGGSNANQIS